MASHFIRRREAVAAHVFVLGLAVPLALGFVGTAEALWVTLAERFPVLPGGPWAAPLGFVSLALLFFVSVRPRPASMAPLRFRRLAATAGVPMLIAYLYGRFMPGLSPLRADPATIVWYLAAVAIGEELLFRGWLYAILVRLFGDRPMTLTTPLPLAVWLTALAFAVWHLQAYPRDPAALVAFRVVYTFFTGVWLGYLRWRTDRLWAPLYAHLLLNLATALA